MFPGRRLDIKVEHHACRKKQAWSRASTSPDMFAFGISTLRMWLRAGYQDPAENSSQTCSNSLENLH